MADSLTVASAVETLVDLDLVDLDADGPWPGEPDRADAYEPDWTQVHPETRSAECVGRHAYEFACEPWSAVIDALAWYTPIHYFGLGMAIYIRESEI